MISIKNVTKRFGGIVAVNDSSSSVAQSSICSLIGPNGAGKSTLFNCISRVYPIDEGEIHLGNIRIDKMPAHKIATLGVGRSFQLTRVLDELSVTENLSLHTSAGFNFHLLKAAVTKEDNEGFYNLLKEWKRQTGCPILLNTSLNIKGKPMVNDKRDGQDFERKYNVKVV